MIGIHHYKKLITNSKYMSINAQESDIIQNSFHIFSVNLDIKFQIY